MVLRRPYRFRVIVRDSVPVVLKLPKNKTIRIRREKDGSQTLDVELYDKVGVLRLLAKASGLLDNPDDGSDKPSVLDVNVIAPPSEQEP